MKERIITGIIMAILFLIPFFAGNYWFIGLTVLMAAVGYDELMKMVGVERWGVRWFIGLMSLVTLFWPLLIETDGLVGIAAIMQHSVLIILMMAVLAATVFSKEFSFEKAGALLMGVAYIGFGFVAMADARIENGALWTFSILLTIWATDSGSYFVGKKIGKRKLAEKISPNKTIEGTTGGIVIALVVGIVLQATLGSYENFVFAIVISLMVSVTGQLGDLIESGIKRTYGVKDSGKLLPGHGGILDRTDSWIFVFIGLQMFGLI